MRKEELIAYIRPQYGADPEYLWENAPNTFVFWHQNKRKWFAGVMDVQLTKLGLPDEGSVFIMDAKCGHILSGSYIGKPGLSRICS